MKVSNLEIKQLSELSTAACGHVGPYSGICEAFGKLAAWAGPRGLLTPEAVMIGIYHDCPTSVPAEQLRSDACLVLKEEVAVEGEIRHYMVSGGKYAVVRAEIIMADCCGAWNKAYEMVVEQGLECDSRDHYELYLNNPGEDPDGIWILDICIPVK